MCLLIIWACRSLFADFCGCGDERSSGRGLALLKRVKMLNIPAGPPRAPRRHEAHNEPRDCFLPGCKLRGCYLLRAHLLPPLRAEGWKVSRRAHLACVHPPPTTPLPPSHPAASAVRRWCSRGSHSLLQLRVSDPDCGCCQASPAPQAVCLSVFCLSLCLPVCVFSCV